MLKPGVYKSLDAWRGVAALWVVMYHMALVITVTRNSLAAQPIYAFSLFGGLGVQMFFVISGYCIANAACKTLTRGENVGKFLAARVRRIYPPCWAALVLAGVLSLVAVKLVERGNIGPSVTAQHSILHQNALYFFANITLTQAVFRVPSLLAQTWTLCYEAAFYAIVGIFMAVAMFRQERRLLNALHTLTCLLIALLVLIPACVPYPLDLWPEFGLGILVYDWLTHPQTTTPKIFAAACAALIFAFVAVRNFPIGVMGEASRVTFLFSLLFAAALVLLHRYDARMSTRRSVRLLSGVGLFSYSLYLTHTFSIGIVNQAVKKFHLPESLHLVAFFAVIIGAVAFARVFFWFFERPFMTALHKRRSALSEGDEKTPSEDVSHTPVFKVAS